jgi:hypothetical protein
MASRSHGGAGRHGTDRWPDLRGVPDLPVSIEIKKGGRPDIEERVAAAIDAVGAQSEALVASHSRTTVQ